MPGKLDPDPSNPRSSAAAPWAALIALLPASAAAAAPLPEGDPFSGLGHHAVALVAVLFLTSLFTFAQTTVASLGPVALQDIEESRSLASRLWRRFLGRLPRLEQQFAQAANCMLIMTTFLMARIGMALIAGSPAAGAALFMVLAFVMHLFLIEVLCRSIALAQPKKLHHFVLVVAYFLSLPFVVLLLPFALFRSLPRAEQKPGTLLDMNLRLLPSLQGIERVIDEEAFEMIDSVREFAESSAEDIMTPRTELEGIPHDLAAGEIYEVLRRTPFSRLVVYNETMDNITGTILAKEVLLKRPKEPATLVRPAVFAPEGMRLPELLRIIREKKTHLIVIQDEYGGTSGIVTLHDLMEVIVGHIEDIEDADELWIAKIADSQWRIGGRVEVWEVNEELDLKIDEETARTIGGLVFHTLGRPAEPGDEVVVDGVRLLVEETRENRVEVLLLEVLPPAEAPLVETAER